MKNIEKTIARVPSGISARIVYVAFYVTIGMVLPQAFHLLGGAPMGAVFLPIHIPAILAGLTLGKREGLVVGLILPFVSFMLSGMPNAIRLPFMIVELCTYGFVSAVLIKRTKNIYLSLVGAMICGRLMFFVFALFSFSVLGFGLGGAAMLFGIIITGLPGAIVQICVIPPLAISLRRYLLGNSYYSKANNKH